MAHVTEVRSAQCRYLSVRYSRLADQLEAIGSTVDAARMRDFANQYEQEAVDLVTGRAGGAACVMALSLGEIGSLGD